MASSRKIPADTARTNPFDSSSSSSSGSGSSSSSSVDEFGDEDLSAAAAGSAPAAATATSAPAPHGMFDDELHSLLLPADSATCTSNTATSNADGTAGGGDTSTQSAARRRDGAGPGDREYISPLEAALLYGVMSPASYRDDYDVESSDEDSSSGSSRLLPSGTDTNNPQHHGNDVGADADASATPSSWWTRVVSTLSPSPKVMGKGGDDRQEVSTTPIHHVQQVGSGGSDDASFQSARSNHTSGAAAGESSPVGNEVDVPAPTKTTRTSSNYQDAQRSSVHFLPQTPVQHTRTVQQTPAARIMAAGQTPRSRRSSKRKRRRPTLLPPQPSIVLEDIGTNAAGSEFTLDYHSPGTPWTKVILLEELGTASSWLVLLLPYIAFLIALALDSTSILQDVTLGPLGCQNACIEGTSSSVNGTRSVAAVFPLAPIPTTSCSYPYEIQDGQGLLSHVNARNEIVDRRYQFFMSNGMAVTSGPIRDVPAMSSFLYGDMTFTDLSSDAVALVTKGSVLTSTAVFQRRFDDDDDVTSTLLGDNSLTDDGIEEQEWFPVSISEPKRLDMVCRYGKLSDGKWNCTSPQTVDVLFSLPATAVLTGGDIRVDTIFSYYAARPYDGWTRRLNAASADADRNESGYQDHRSLKSGRNDMVEDLLSEPDLSHPKQLLAEIATASAYILRHQRPAYAELIVIVRLISLALSFVFSFYWVMRMGFVGFCCERRDALDDDEDTEWHSNCELLSLCEQGQNTHEELVRKKSEKGRLMWWESPSIVFPERKYLLFVLLCLLMVQNPLLAVAYYRPQLYSSAEMHVAADCLIGVGVHGILMLTTCLMQGLRYHTAAFNRKRARQQRKALELGRTARHLALEGHPDYGTDASASSYMATYYERYGDTEGIGFAGALHSRLRHDPCGAQWADFLLPKLALLTSGVVFVILGAMSRFPGQIAIGRHNGQYINANTATINRDALAFYKYVYIISSFGQFSVLVTWGILILSNTVITGNRLKREPFLSTRPAQLAFRVLTGILFLGFMAVLVPFVFELFVALAKWMGLDNHVAAQDNLPGSEIIHHTSSGFYLMDAQPSPLEVLVSVVVHATSRFPYSGTAASIGPGKILYVTVCSLVAAYIFLPAASVNDSIESETSPENRTASTIDRDLQRQDKRQVVTLAKYTHSWRVFPLPIERKAVLYHPPVSSKILPPDAFELSVDGQKRKASFRRGIVYKGKYMPVFCLETACWLLEAAWQAYYSHDEFKTDDWAPGRMSLDSVGLALDAAIHDDQFDTKAYIMTNIKPQVDGEEDSIIVVAFRGTASSKNMRTDLNWKQVPLPGNIQGSSSRADYQVRVGRSNDDHKDGNTLESAPSVSLLKPRRLHDKHFAPSIILKATPLVRQALPCVHEGFLSAYMHIREEVLDHVIVVFQRQLDAALRTAQEKRRGSGQFIHDAPSLNIPKIYVTGHSLGGSLAQLLALDLACNCEVIVEGMVNHSKEPRPTPEPLSLPSVARSNRKRSLTQTDDPFLPKQRFSADAGSPDELAKGACDAATPVRRRRNSFPSKRNLSDSQHERRMHGTSSGAEDFLHAIFSGEAFRRRKQKTSLQPPIAVYTFGQPRVGNKAFARLYKQRVPHTFRVVNEGDAFTSLPIATCFGGMYKHAGLDVVLDEGCTGNILVGPTVVETMFRFSKVRTNVSAHLMEKYRDNLESALSVDELQEYYRGHGGKGGNKGEMGTGGNQGSRQSLPDWVTSVKRSIR